VDDPDLAPDVVKARAARVGRELSPEQLAALVDSSAAIETTYAALRARPVGLLSGQTDHAWGDAWLRRAASKTPPSSPADAGDQ
jgi:hypothetical protein